MSIMEETATRIAVWMRLLQLHQHGLNRRFMLTGFAVRVVTQLALSLKKSGLTVDRLFLLMITAASGRNFINVNVAQAGGAGVPIAHPMT